MYRPQSSPHGGHDKMRRRVALALILVALPALAAAPGREIVPGQRVRVQRLFRADKAQVYYPGRGTLWGGNLNTAIQYNYAQLRTATTELLRRYPADRSFFVGVGRSPAPLVAILQNLHPDLAINFPASGLSGRSGIDRRYLGEYHRHFAAFFPPEVIWGHRDIVLIDRSVGGHSIATLKWLLQEWLVGIGSKVQVRGVGFSNYISAKGVDRIDTQRFPVLSELLQEPFETWFGEFVGSHPIGLRRLEDLRRNSGYDHAKNLLRELMETDSHLDGELQNIPGIEVVP